MKQSMLMRFVTEKQKLCILYYQYHIHVDPRATKEPGLHLNIKNIFPGIEIPI